MPRWWSGCGKGSSMSKRIKCLVWDLDRTLWEGTLTEGGGVVLRDGVRETLEELDKRGILFSIASKNESGPALRRLEELGIADYFLCPEISWDGKAEGIRRIAETLNLKLDAFAIIDDSVFERDAVQYVLPSVSVYPETAVKTLPTLPEFSPRFVTEDSRNRRRMYQADLVRRKAKEHCDSEEEFLRTLDIHATLRPVGEEDLQRVEELTIRTHQLNSTGYTYSYDELVELTRSPGYIFQVCGLRDKYGDSGKVGLLLLKEDADALTVKLLIVSCRVMAYGVGSALLTHAIRMAAERGKRLRAEFLETEHNRIMYVTYKFAGFEEIEEQEERLLLEYRGEGIPALPDYITWD